MSPEIRQRILSGVQDAVILGSGFETACDAIGMSPRRLQRWRTRVQDRRRGGLRTSDQKLSEQEKDAIVEAFHKPEYVDLPIRAARLSQDVAGLVKSRKRFRGRLALQQSVLVA